MSTINKQNAEKLAIVNDLRKSIGNIAAEIYLSQGKVSNAQSKLIKAMFDATTYNFSKEGLHHFFFKADDNKRAQERDAILRDFVPQYGKDLHALTNLKGKEHGAERKMLGDKLRPFQMLYIRTLQVLNLLRVHDVKELIVTSKGLLSFKPANGDPRIVAMSALFNEAKKVSNAKSRERAGKVEGKPATVEDGIKQSAIAITKTLHAIDAAAKKLGKPADPLGADAQKALNELFAALATRVDNAKLARVVQASRKPVKPGKPEVVQRNGVSVVATSADLNPSNAPSPVKPTAATA